MAGYPFNFPRIRRGAFQLGAAYGFFKIANHCFTSDFIVPRQNQDIHAGMPEMPRNRIMRRFETHMSIVDGTTGPSDKADIFAYINGDTRLAIHAAVGQNQPEPTAGSLYRTNYFDHKSNNETVTAITNSHLFSFSGFSYNDFLFNPNGSLTWMRNVDGVITKRENAGSPKYIFGNLNNYYMNQDKLEIRVNTHPWSTLVFGEHFGNWDSRRFHHGFSNGTYNVHDYRGSLFFAPVNPAQFVRGENSVIVRVTSPLGQYREAHVTLINGSSVPVVELNELGEPISNGLIGQGTRIQAGAAETFYFRIDAEIYPDAPGTSLELATTNGATQFTRVSGVAPQPGQFRFIATTSPNIYRIELNLPESMLARDEGGTLPNPAQQLIFKLINTSGMDLLKHQPFTVDPLPPVVIPTDQYVVGDHDGNGFVNSQDICHQGGQTMDPAQCQTLCTIAGITDPDECNMAKSQCMAEAVKVAPGMPDCDGLDNDYDAYTDANDINETHSINYYSPKFDAGGTLMSQPVPISFVATDNASSVHPQPKAVVWRIQKVTGLGYSSSDPIIFARYVDPASVTYGENFTDFWNFEGFGSFALDGQYCYTVAVADRVGSIGADEGVSQPSCFIVDTQAPPLTVVKGAQDDRGLGEYSKFSEYFSAAFRPTSGSGYLTSSFDSPAETIILRFIPQGDKASLEPIDFEVIPTYFDLSTHNANGDVTSPSPDGQIDATIWHLPDYAEMAEMGEEEFALPDGLFQVQYIATDKAGNTTVVDGGLIQKARGDGPPVNSDIYGGVSTRNPGSSSTTYTATVPEPIGQGDVWPHITVTVAEGKDFVQTLKVNTTNIQPGAIFGLDARLTGEPVEPHVCIGLNQNGTIQVLTRPDGRSPGTVTNISGNFSNTPIWVRVERKGNTVEVSYSTNGQTFIVVGSQNLGTGSLVVGPFMNGAPGSTITWTMPDADWVIGNKDLGATSCGDALALFTQQDMNLADRVQTFGQVRSNGAFELGADALIQGNFYGGSTAFLRERAKIQGNATIYGSLTRQNQTLITGSLTQGQVLTPCAMPTLPTAIVGSQNVTVGNDQTLQLAPGNYGDLIVYSRATLKLSSGIYRFKSFRIEPDVILELDARITKLDIRVRDFMALGDRFKMQLSQGSVPSLIHFTSHQTSELRLGTDSKFVGNLLAPNAQVWVNSRPNQQGQAQFYGRLQAKRLRIEPDSRLDAFSMP